MWDKTTIHSREFAVLVAMFTLGSAILLIPTTIIQEALQDGWISAIIGVCGSLVLVLIYCGLIRLYPNMNLFHLNEQILGNWMGKGLSFFFLLFFAISSAAILRDVGDFITTQILPGTPIEVVHICFLAIMIYAARLGIVVIARTALMMFPVVISLYVLITLLVSPNIEFENLLPVYSEGWMPIYKGMLPFLAFPFAQLIIILMFIPNIMNHERVPKAFLCGTLISGIMLAMVVGFTLLVLGPQEAQRSIYSSYTLAKHVSIGNFLERIEATTATIWFFTVFIKLSVFFHGTCFGIAQLFKLNDLKITTLPVAVIIYSFSLGMAPNIVYWTTTVMAAWTPLALTFGLFIPLGLLVIALIRRMFSKKTSKQSPV